MKEKLNIIVTGPTSAVRMINEILDREFGFKTFTNKDYLNIIEQTKKELSEESLSTLDSSIPNRYILPKTRLAMMELSDDKSKVAYSGFPNDIEQMKDFEGFLYGRRHHVDLIINVTGTFELLKQFALSNAENYISKPIPQEEIELIEEKIKQDKLLSEKVVNFFQGRRKVFELDLSTDDIKKNLEEALETI